ncbi:hypothetical protein [Rhodanobacter sp. DHG33]|uniref:hypothetical protein n=1 Tax=Rhodanobacter sp. DHG33 TaxID=2775921 RepID=UPI00177A7CDC|nr:hypothetical protein [Rhodanobacter sp. DHG33]MBD8897712.1 hypothetical protein [Rhodanobacter sp. DHG33]
MRMITRAVFAVSIAIATGTALAATPATGLGQSWPNASDVSTSPNFHVYVFALGGVKYIQVNDLNGNVLGSVGTAGGQFITLPIGRYAQQVATPSQPAAVTTDATPAAAPATVYNDGTTAVTATPMTDGTMALSAAAANQPCNDPVDCSMKGVTGQSNAISATTPATVYNNRATAMTAAPMSGGTMTPAATSQPCDDPVDCSMKGVTGQSNAASAAAPATVYNNRSTAVTAAPMTGGTMTPAAASQPCDDPVDCSMKGITGQ